MHNLLRPVVSCMLLAFASSASVAQETGLPALPPVALPGSENAVPVINATQIANEVKAEEAAQAEQVVKAVSEPIAPLDKKEEEGFSPSYGAFPSSVLFSDREIEQIKKVLFLTERFSNDNSAEEVVKNDKDEGETIAIPLPLPKPEPEKIATPNSFPTFAISSVIYRGPKDWVLWINGKRATLDSLPKGLEVTRISSRSVKLLWSPEDSASFLFHQENLKEQEEPAGLKRIISPSSKVSQVGTNQWEFTLRPNQTFDARYMAVLEGKNPKVEGSSTKVMVKQMPEQTAEDILRQAGFPQQQSQGGRRPTVDEKLRGIAGALQDNSRMLQGLRPKSAQTKRSGFHVDSNLRSDRSASAPPVEVAAPEPSTEDKLKKALPAFLESIGVSPQTEENNAGNEGLPLLPNQ